MEVEENAEDDKTIDKNDQVHSNDYVEPVLESFLGKTIITVLATS